MPIDYEPVIGLEVHVQLATATKLFCRCTTRFGMPPNSQVCPVCLGLPGTLPMLNRRAVELAVRVALALELRLHPTSVFSRKHYFYPDLPKGYQVSQYDRPYSTDGHLDVEVDGALLRVGITRIHLEEDAGKSSHGLGGDSLVDLNRAGVPLIEVVGAPELGSARAAVAYLRALRDVVMAVGAGDGNMEEGNFRCDANVSVRPRGSRRLGTRCELKNLNSFRFVEQAIEVEIARQIAVLDGGGSVVQETRGFDPDARRTFSLRSKEDAHDYRYFPEPDLPPLVLHEALVAEQRASLPRLPAELRREWQAELGLSAAAVQTLTGHPSIARYYEALRGLAPDPVKAANWVVTELLRDTTAHGLEARFPVTPEQLAELLALIEAGSISGKQGKAVFAALSGTDRRAAEVVAERGLAVVSDEGALRTLCEALIAEHPRQAAGVRGGNAKLVGFFVGQVMQRTKGSASPQLVNRLLGELLAPGA